MEKIDLNAIPRLVYDYKVREEDQFYLIYLEKIGLSLAVNYCALSIIELCDGARTLNEIIDITIVTFTGTKKKISKEVIDNVSELTKFNIITFDKIKYETPSVQCFDPVKGLYPLKDAAAFKYGGTGAGGNAKCKRGQN